MKVRDTGWVFGFAKFCIAAGLGMAAMNCAAQAVTIKNAWVRAPVAGQKTAGAYLELTSASHAALVDAESPAAGSVELHTMSVDDGVMRMRRVERIDLPARKVVTLAPGGLHLMLIGLKQPLKVGDKVPLALAIETQRGVRTVHKLEAEVRAPGATGSHQH